jgi:hypothetical protein
MMNKQATNHTKNQSRKEWLAVVTRNRGGTWVGENRGSFQTGTYRTYEVTILPSPEKKGCWYKALFIQNIPQRTFVPIEYKH